MTSAQDAWAAGIDLGGSKIETQVFSRAGRVLAERRCDTPDSYGDLLAALVAQAAWVARDFGVPLGLASAGLVDTAGKMLAANLAANGQDLTGDLAAASGQRIPLINDARAFTLAEAQRGAGQGARLVVGLTLGTGLGGGVALNGRLVQGAAGIGGEFGHMPLSAALVARLGLPILPCGCGQTGCVETLLSGLGLMNLARHLGSPIDSAQAVIDGRQVGGKLDAAYRLWLAVLADLIVTLTWSLTPDRVVLGGGMAAIPGLRDDLGAVLAAARHPALTLPTVVLGTTGRSSVCLGAALLAAEGA